MSNEQAVSGDDQSPVPYDGNRCSIYWNSFLPIFFDRMNHLMRSAMSRIVEPYGLTSAHAFYLMALDLVDGRTQAELSDFLDMDPANTNRVIRILTDKGLVRDDRRTPTSKKYCIFLTDAGKKVADEVLTGTQNNMESMFGVLSRDEADSMKEMLIRVMENSDPGFMEGSGRSHVDPFYAHLASTACRVSQKASDDGTGRRWD